MHVINFAQNSEGVGGQKKRHKLVGGWEGGGKCFLMKTWLCQFHHPQMW